MSWLSLSDIAEMTGGELHGNDVQLNAVSIDSRKVSNDDLFIAIKGERFDAHDFVAELEGKVGAALVSQLVDCSLPQVVVKDTLQALADLSAKWRQTFSKPVIGLTGSNGKTTLKEMVAAILSEKGKVLSTNGNFNNDIGLPLTLLRIRESDDYAVIEMGANHFDEIDFLTHIAKPDIAVINNAGPAHLEGFGDIEGVAKAKGEIFGGLNESGIAIINADDEYADYWLGLNKQHKVITFGLDAPADISGEFNAQEKLKINVTDKAANEVTNNEIEVNLKLLGKHNAMNALAATAIVSALDIDLETVKKGLEALEPVKGRLAAVAGIQGISLIDDTYNANPASADAAIDVLAAMSGTRMMILGDMGELGSDADNLHAGVGKKAKQSGIDYLLCLGAGSAQACEVFGQSEYAYQQLDDLVLSAKKIINNNVDKDMAILVKGSRTMKMENVVAALSVEQETSKC